MGGSKTKLRIHAGVSKSPLCGALPVPTTNPQGKELSSRLRETLALLLDAKSEKQVGAALAISRHTVHVYVKELYRLYGVCTRCELIVLIYQSALRSLVSQNSD